MRITRGGAAPRRSDTFTGTVYGQPILPSTDGVMINSVLFEPGARTHWHRHERGQVLHVTSGRGRVRNRDGEGAVIGVGDTVWIPPGEEHWHGAEGDAYLVHLAISLGETEWLEPVSDDDYQRGETG